MKIKKLGALLVSVALCAGMAAPAFVKDVVLLSAGATQYSEWKAHPFAS